MTRTEKRAASPASGRARRPRAQGRRLGLLALLLPLLGAETTRASFETWRQEVEPALAAGCGGCHLGEPFGFAGLRRSGAAFDVADSEANYRTFLDLLCLDAPTQSRLLAKALGEGHRLGIRHGPGPVLEESDPLFLTLRRWAEEEKAERCPDCGLDAPRQYLAYVEMPRLYWALERDPTRPDRGLRQRTRLMMQPMDPESFRPVGEPFDFLGESFCGADGRCDFANPAASHAGDRLAFECRLSEDPDADWVEDVRWNVCIAEIGPDGRASNPRFLMPPERRHFGKMQSRASPFGLRREDGSPLKGTYDHHWSLRRRADSTPAFSPDDALVYLSSQGPDPRTGHESY